jgi:hypothetical protein
MEGAEDGKQPNIIDPITYSVEDRITKRAFELYVARGCQPGKALEDWLQAEREIKREEEAARQWKLSH